MNWMSLPEAPEYFDAFGLIDTDSRVLHALRRGLR
jgi:hypothetical protein